MPGTSGSIAIGVASGVAASFLPFIGLHFLIAALIALLLRGNVLASAIGIAGGTESPVVHVVLVWLKDPGNAAHRARIVEATRAFAGLPGVEEIRVGEPVPSARASVDDCASSACLCNKRAAARSAAALAAVSFSALASHRCASRALLNSADF